MPRGKPKEPRVWSPTQRARALELIDSLGLAKARQALAAEGLSIPKSTLHLWAKDANVATASEEARAKTEAATEASVQARREKLEQSRDRMSVRLALIAETAASKELEYIKQGKATLSELVGARTRAIHDLQLLDGKATERTATSVSAEQAAALRDSLRERLSS